MLIGQDTVVISTNRSYISIQAGISYKTFLGDKYIVPAKGEHDDEFEDHQYEGFNKIPTVGFNIGLLFTYPFNNRCGIVSGLSYSLRKDVFERSQDSAIKYGDGSDMRNIHNIYKYEYVFNNLEIPILFQFSQNKYNFYVGSYISLIAYKKANYKYIVDQYPNSIRWATSEKTIFDLEIPLKIFPTLQMSHEIRLSDITLHPYFAIYYAILNQNDLYFQFGFNLPLNSAK